MLNDVRYALRTLAASPGFTLAAVLTLALGIGANTAIFTAVYGVLLKPLPYGEPDRIVRISETRRGGPWNVAWPNYVDWRARNHVFADMAIFNTYGRVIVGGAAGTTAELFPSGTCETQMFAVMGIPAARGRVFTPDERESGAPGVAIVSDELWRRRFGGDPSIVGQPARVDDEELTIVGVLPPGVRPFDVDIWFPHRPALLNDMQRDRANHPGLRCRRAAAAGRERGPRAARDVGDRGVPREGIPRVEHRVRRGGEADDRRRRRHDPPDAAPAHGIGRGAAAHRLRQRGEPAAREGAPPRAGDLDSIGARRQPLPAGAAVPD